MNEKRILRLINSLISQYSLDLQDLRVFTEAGSGYYLLTPIICALAGAECVYAITGDSFWGKAADIQAKAIHLANRWGIRNRINFTTEKRPDELAQSDIVTNLGFVRPIDAGTVKVMKNTAVVPLMWETWEFRPGEVDLAACRKKDILVLGTDEHKIHFMQYAAYLDWKLLFDAQVEIYKNKILVFSSNPVARVINRMFTNNDIDYRYISFDVEPDTEFSDRHISPYDKKSVFEYLSQCDAILVDEKTYNNPIITTHGVISPEELLEINDSAVLVFRSGVIDYQALRQLGVEIQPGRYASYGYSAVGSYDLGPRPLVELHVAGLRVGEVMARARLRGLDIVQAARRALKDSPAMDFSGPDSWIDHDA